MDNYDRAQHEPLINYLAKLYKEKFYGTISLRFDKGILVLLNIQQSLKPEALLTSTEETKPRRSDAVSGTM